jgi:hypothetical protein
MCLQSHILKDYSLTLSLFGNHLISDKMKKLQDNADVFGIF